MNTNPKAKSIVCYGDSNTWGANPYEDGRWPADVRWTGILQQCMGEDWDVVEEGLCGRTFVAENPQSPHRTGITHLKSILDTHEPIHTLIVMLGTNDVKSTFGLSAEAVAADLDQTLRFVKQNADSPVKRILVICPAAVAIPKNDTLDPRYEGRINISKQLAKLFKMVADKHGAQFMDAGELYTLEDTDGYHLNSVQHKILGENVAAILKAR